MITKALTIALSSVFLSAYAMSPNFGESDLIDFNESFKTSNVLETKFRLINVDAVEYGLVVHQGNIQNKEV